MTDPYNPNPSQPDPGRPGSSDKTEIINSPGAQQGAGAPQADPTTVNQNPAFGQPPQNPYQQNPYGQPPQGGFPQNQPDPGPPQPGQAQPTQVAFPASQPGGQYGPPDQQGFGQQAPGQPNYGAPGFGGPSQPYGQPGQFGQPGQYGQPGQAPGPQGPYGQQFGGSDQFAGMATPPKSNKKLRTALFAGGGVLVLVAAILLITAFAWPGWAPKNLDQQAAQQGVQKILTEDYQASEVSDVKCPSGQRVKKGESFTCSVKVGGQDQKVTVTFIDDDGKYEVSRPS